MISESSFVVFSGQSKQTNRIADDRSDHQKDVQSGERFAEIRQSLVHIE